MVLKQIKKTEEKPDKSPNKPLIAIDNKNSSKNVENINEIQNSTSEANGVLTYAQSAQIDNREVRDNNQTDDNLEPKYRIMNNKVIDRNGYELVVSYNNKKRKEQINNNNNKAFSGPSNNVNQSTDNREV